MLERAKHIMKLGFEPIKKKQKLNEYNPRQRRDDDLSINQEVELQVKLYNNHSILEFEPSTIQEAISLIKQYRDYKIWINIDGINKEVVFKMCNYFNVHKLIADDILSVGQRAKMDDFEDGLLYILIPILRWDATKNAADKEQLSIVMGSNFIITFQEKPLLDSFDKIRIAMRSSSHPIRQRNIDFLLHQIIDAVVDDYFNLLNTLSEKIEKLDSTISTKRVPSWFLDMLSNLRREIYYVRRVISPVRDVVNSLWITEVQLIEPINKKFFKDVLDHIMLAIEYNDNYREIVVNLQDLYINQINTKTNDIMKILTIVTTLLAPSTLISSIYGMNFERMPILNNEYGFYIALSISFGSTFLMIWYFKRKKWF